MIKYRAFFLALVITTIPLQSHFLNADQSDPIIPSNKLFFHENTEKQYDSFRFQLSDFSNLEKKIYLGPNSRDQKRFVHQFIETLSIKLSEANEWFTFANEPLWNEDLDSSYPVNYHFINCNGEKTEQEHLKQDMAMKAFGSTMAAMIENTGIGQRVKIIEQHILRYFTIEYRKDVEDGRARFYFPSQIKPSLTPEEKEYKIALSSSFNTDIETWESDCSLALDIDLKRIKIDTSYEFNKRKIILSIGKVIFNNYFNTETDINIGLSIHQDSPATSSGLVNISQDF